MVNITVTIKNEAEITAKLATLGIELRDFNKELSKTGQDLVNYFSTVPFDTNGRAYGSPWQEVQPNRLEYKIKHYPQNAHNVLQASGLMRNSFKFLSTKDMLTVMNEQAYFAAHQLGLGHMPQRIMMALNDAVKQTIISNIEDGVQAKINKLT